MEMTEEKHSSKQLA